MSRTGCLAAPAERQHRGPRAAPELACHGSECTEPGGVGQLRRLQAPPGIGPRVGRFSVPGAQAACPTCVSLLLRYGTCPLLLCSEAMTSPRADRLLLMACASFSCCPATSLRAMRSEPAGRGVRWARHAVLGSLSTGLSLCRQTRLEVRSTQMGVHKPAKQRMTEPACPVLAQAGWGTRMSGQRHRSSLKPS